MSLKTAQVASFWTFTGGIDKNMFIQLLPGKSVRYRVLPFAIDCKLTRTVSEAG